jgi:hypothetical protein
VVKVASLHAKRTLTHISNLWTLISQFFL